jgi:mannose-6-phosphate isomerase-like protein (cupin superfamily)
MQQLKTTPHRKLFKVLTRTRSTQAAMMTLQPGQSSSDEPENEHPKSEQWLFVLSGSGRAVVSKRRVTLRTNSLLVIAKGEPHQITNTGSRPLITLNFYVPPAYTKNGELL